MLSTQLKHFSQSELLKKLSICVVSTLLIFLGFYWNSWRVAEHQWFERHQRDSESLIIGRMVESRQAGIFSVGGVLGIGVEVDSELIRISPTQINDQYSAYLNNRSFDGYAPYMSQIGGQGMLFSLFDIHMPFSPQIKLQLLYVLTALLSSIALTAIINWFYDEFGWQVMIFVVGSVVVSQWLTVFGRNLYWGLWAYYLPMIVVIYFLKRHRSSSTPQFIRFGILIFISFSIKCFINGYEYITTTLVMMMVPLVYYAILEKWNWKQCLKWVFAAVLGSGAAIFLSLTLLCIQIGSVKGGLMEGIGYVIYTLGKRTHGNAESYPSGYTPSLDASTVGVVKAYISGVFFDINNYLSHPNSFVSNFLLKIRYYYLIVFFIVMSFFLFLCSKEPVMAERRQHDIALIWTTWFSIIAPLSWYIIFKAHSHNHFHMNFLLWQMPFTLFGFAVIGSAVVAWTIVKDSFDEEQD